MYGAIEYESPWIMPGIINNNDQRYVKRPTRKETLKEDQKSSNPLNESFAVGLIPLARFRYTLEILSVKAGVIINEITKLPPGINANINDAPKDIPEIINVIIKRIPISPLICLFASDFNSALFIRCPPITYFFINIITHKFKYCNTYSRQKQYGTIIL
jgi:hypothetical protein